MDKQAQATPEMDKVAKLVNDIRIAMLTTEEPDGALRSRPLATLQFDSEGQLWFFTSIASPKVEEIEEHRQVNLSYSDPKESDFVSISGTATIVRDRAKMESLWTPWIEPWFPNGLDDPDLALLKITVEQAEYWDAPDSKVGRLFGFARAVTTGNTGSLGSNEKISRTPQ